MSTLAGVKIAVFTTGHPADDARIYYKECRSLDKFGADVTYIFPDFKAPPQPLPGERTIFKSVHLQKGLKSRLLHGNEMFKALLDTDFDIVHCHEPDALYWAVLVKKQRPEIKIIYDSHELWSGVVEERLINPISGYAGCFFGTCEEQLLRYCSGIIGASQGITDTLHKLEPHLPVATILNVPTATTFPEKELSRKLFHTVMVHDGHLSFSRGLKTIVAAVNMLAKEYPIKFKIVGDVVGKEGEWLQEFIAANDLDNVITCTGWLPYDKVGEELAVGHIGISSQIRNRNTAVCAPNKCFNYLYYGLAQVGPHYPDSQYQILANEGCALLYEPENSDDLARALEEYICDQELLREHRQQALRLSKNKYRWEQVEPILIDFYQKVLAQ